MSKSSSSHNQQKSWEAEYRDPQLLSLADAPQADIRRFAKWLREQAVKKLEPAVVLDLGCGNGRNLQYLCEHYDASGIGYDFSATAIARAAAQVVSIPMHLEVRNVGEPLPLPDNAVGLALDVTCSSALFSDERQIFVSEVARTLAPGGYFFVRALTRDGDRNAQNLLRLFPGPEDGTYYHPDLGLVETVVTEKEFRALHEPFFEISHLQKLTGYQRWGAQSYKRRYIVAYLHKPSGSGLVSSDS